VTTRPPSRLLRLAAPFAALAACAPLAAQHVAYEKYTLDNGMTVILHVDHALPIAVVNLWYDVGAKDEPPRRSGFAHLFEHLMFMGTERVPGNDFDVRMERGGGKNNASTTEDRTNYYSEGPSSLLPTLLWLDADRLEDLGRTMTAEKLDRQRDIVRNEIRESVENTPYGRAGELMFALLFPQDHPYHNAVYGRHADLEAATVDDVKDFFATFYVPNNASLVVAGDFDPALVKPRIAALFGTLPRGGDVTRRATAPPRLERVVRTTELDKVQLPMVKMAWLSPAAYADGDAEMRLVAALLSSGKSSRLYKRLVFDDHVATDVDAGQDSLRLGSVFSIDVTCAPGADLDRIERTVDEELERLRSGGVTAAELGQRQAEFELGQLARLQRLGAVADQLNAYEHAYGEPDSFARDLDRYRKATPAMVQQWAKQVLDPARRAIVRVLPEQPERRPSARDEQPEPGETGAFAPPMPTTFTLHNGIPVHVWSRPALPLVSLQLVCIPGTLVTEPARAGLPSLTASLMQEGAGNRDALAFADAMQSLGAAYGIGADHETGNASLTVLRRNFEDAAGLLADAVQRPRMQPQDFARVHQLVLDGLRQQDDDAGLVAARAGMRALFGSKHPYGWPVSGTVDTVAPLSLADVQAQHRALFTPGNAVLLVAGDLKADDARQVLERAFGGWEGPPKSRVAPPDLPAPAGNGLRVVLIDRPAAVQTVVRFFAPAPRYRQAARMPLQVLNMLLGGSFTSRLNQNLREKHGYSYGASSSYSFAPSCGFFSAGADVKADVTGASVRELLAELRRLAADHGDVTDEEAQKARQSLRTEFIDSHAGLQGLIGSAVDLVLNDMPFTTVADDLAALPKIGAAELNALGRSAVPLDQGILVLVGDLATMRAQLEGLGLPEPELRDVQGEPMKR
jgi:predicted Zn-dependent peptidase